LKKIMVRSGNVGGRDYDGIKQQGKGKLGAVAADQGAERSTGQQKPGKLIETNFEG
jgi:hypothetical protein